MSQVQVSPQFWRNDPWHSPEVMLNMPEFPQQLLPAREGLERQLRELLQTRAGENPLRATLYNQLSANNYQTADWVSIVTSVGLLMEALIVVQRAPVDNTLTSYVLNRMCNSYLVRLVDQNPTLGNYMGPNEWHIFNQLRQDRTQDIALVESLAAQKAAQQQQQYQQPYGTMNYQQQQGYGYQQQQQQTLHNMAQGNMGAGLYGGLRQPVQHDPLSIRSGANLEPVAVVEPGNVMQQAFQSAVIGASRTQTADQFLQTRGAPVTKPASPILETLSLKPTGEVVYQQGGETVEFNQFFTESDQRRIEAAGAYESQYAPEAQVEGPKEYKGLLIPVVDFEGIKRPIVYNKISDRVNEKGELIMTNMRYEDHELKRENIAEAPGLRVIPIFEEEAVPEPNATVARHWLYQNQSVELEEPLLNIELDSAFQYADFDNSAYTEQKIVKFINLRTDAAMLVDAKVFYEEYKDFAIGSVETSMVKLWNQLKGMGELSHAMARKIDERATKATNHVINNVLGLPFTIDSFLEDFPNIHDYLVSKYGEIHATRFKQNLQSIHNALCCLLTFDLGYTVIDRTAMTIQAVNASGLKWDRETNRFRPLTIEELERIESFKTDQQESMGPVQDFTVQLATNEYCVLLPVEFERLKLVVGNEPTVILPSVTPELADFVNEIYDEAGGTGNRFYRIVLGTVDGVLLHLFPTPGVDTDNRTLFAVERIKA